MKGINIPYEKIAGCKYGDVRNRVFETSQRLIMDELARIVFIMNCTRNRLWDIVSHTPVIVNNLAILHPTGAPRTPQTRIHLWRKILIVKKSLWWE